MFSRRVPTQKDQNWLCELSANVLTQAASASDTDKLAKGVSWVEVDYASKADLVKNLQGVNTLLSFVVVHADPGSVVQKNLIDAAIEAGVKRVAPSEWGS